MTIYDDSGKPLEIGMRVGCRHKGEPRSHSVRGLTLTGYDPESDRPFITDGGRFHHAIKDHQPDAKAWIAKHVQ